MKKTQDKVKEFIEKNNLKSSIEADALDLVSEIGEVSKEILKMNDYGTKSLELNEEIKFEIGDVFFSLIKLSNKLKIDLEDALNLVLNKYQNRFDKKGEISSN